MRKLLIRCSPPVRMTRSGSGRPPVYSASLIVRSSTCVGRDARGGDRPERVDELRPARVVPRDVEVEPGARRGAVEGPFDGGAGRLRQLVEPPQELDPDALGRELVGLARDRAAEEVEQPRDLVVGAGPVLAAERVDREHRDAAPDRVLEEAADRLDPGRMAVEVRQVPGAGPAAVAVHDDRDVPGQVLGREQRRLGGRRDGLRRRRLALDVREGRGVGRPRERAIERRLGH